MLAYRSPSRPHSLLHLPLLLHPATQHIPLNCTAAHFTATLPLSTFHSTVPQPTALLPSHSAHSTPMYTSPLHFRCSLAQIISHNSPVLPLTSCHLPLSVHSFRCSFSSLTVHCHEPATQYVLHVTPIWTPPTHVKSAIPGLSFGTQHFLLSPKQLLCSCRFCTAASHRYIHSSNFL